MIRSGTINRFTAPSGIFPSDLQPTFPITSLTVLSIHLSVIPWTHALAMQSVRIHHSRFSISPSRLVSLGTTVDVQNPLQDAEHLERLFSEQIASCRTGGTPQSANRARRSFSFILPIVPT